MNIDYGVFFCVCWLWRFIQFNPIFGRQFATNSCEQRGKKSIQTKIAHNFYCWRNFRSVYLNSEFLTLNRHKVGFIDYVNPVCAKKMLFTFWSLILLILFCFRHAVKLNPNIFVCVHKFWSFNKHENMLLSAWANCVFWAIEFDFWSRKRQISFE